MASAVLFIWSIAPCTVMSRGKSHPTSPPFACGILLDWWDDGAGRVQSDCTIPLGCKFTRKNKAGQIVPEGKDSCTAGAGKLKREDRVKF